jgi:tRNA threonylcarbamoyladenosine biosynthesis protein TsaB
VILGIDTATPSTAVAVWSPGLAVERRDDPAPGARPGHASRLLTLVEEVLEGRWDAVDRIAVGIGPGGFTGLRLGIATARALAQARGLPLVGVSSLAALAYGVRGSDPIPGFGSSARNAAAATGPKGSDPARGQSWPEDRAGRPVVAVIDARRGEVFAAAGDALPPTALAPEALAERIAPGSMTVGDGAVRFRQELERAGALVPVDDSPLHRLSAVQVCWLGAMGEPADRDGLLPDYRREPDAKPRQQ